MIEYRLRHVRLRDFAPGTKIAYTVLLLYLLLGLGTIVAIEALKTGWTPGGVADYYRGNEQRFLFEKTPLEMLEVTHMHLFSIPVVFFILGHAFLMTTLKTGVKISVMLAGFAAVFGSIAGPWAVRFGSSAFGWVKVLSDLTLSATLLLMTVIPMVDMWMAPPRAGRRP